MPKCITCGEFTKYEGGLCYKCYKKQNNKSTKVEDSYTEETEIEKNHNGLTDKDWEFRYNMIKGRIVFNIENTSS